MFHKQTNKHQGNKTNIKTNIYMKERERNKKKEKPHQKDCLL